MADCIFCSIVAGDIPATRGYEDERTLAFADTNPQAPTHLLVVPKEDFTDTADVSRDPEVGADYLAGIRADAEQDRLRDLRVVFDIGADGAQSHFHQHAHM